jgi:hypothetical protein
MTGQRMSEPSWTRYLPRLERAGGGVRLLSEEKRADRTEVTALTERAVGV